ncbi:MAG: hypothetical protein HY290_16880 [Planctomycetia bacterium]|nr:hypothetical protein [Planctomycetia bacterium]
METAYLLAVLSAESIHGEAQVRLDEAHVFEPVSRTCTIDASTPVGRDINRLFTGYVRREFDEGQFQIKRLDAAATGELAGTTI